MIEESDSCDDGEERRRGCNEEVEGVMSGSLFRFVEEWCFRGRDGWNVDDALIGQETPIIERFAVIPAETEILRTEEYAMRQVRRGGGENRQR